MVAMPANRTTRSTGIAIVMKVAPKWSACATRASAITAPERIARKMVTRLRDSLYVRVRVASRLQCSVARICPLAAASGSRPAGGVCVDNSRLLPRRLVGDAEHAVAQAPRVQELEWHRFASVVEESPAGADHDRADVAVEVSQ